MTMTQATVTYDDVIKFITTEADREQLTSIANAHNARTKILRSVQTAQAAATVKVGLAVELTGLKPKYLNGLKGKVTKVERERVQVELDEDSSTTLQFTRQSRYHRIGTAPMTVPGLPVGCLKF